MSDLKFFPTIEGADIKLDPNSRDFILDQGLSTAVYLSLFASPYWGNSILQAGERLLSNLSELWKLTVTTSTRNQIKRSAEKSLEWLLAFGIASEVQVEAEIQGIQRIALRIIIQEPERDARQVFSYQLNWDQQKVIMRG